MYRAHSGSANRSRARSARAAALFTSTRFDATPMRTLALAPERSSPFHVLEPLGGGAGEVVGQCRDLEDVVVLERVGLGHHPPEPGLGLLVVGAVHEQHAVE